MLQGVRIIEFAEGVAGPMAAMRLGDLGADVVKVETSEGDWMRDAEPAMDDGMSAAFFSLNRGKRSVALGSDPKAAASLLLRLLAKADAFITDRSDAELRELGLGDALQPKWFANPGLVIVDVSIWGAKGPMAESAGSELAVQAMAGYTRYLGSRKDPPRRLGADVAGCGASAFTVQAVIAALFERDRSPDSVGQRVSTSMLNSLISMKSIHLAAQTNPDQYAGPRVGGAHYPPEKGWRTKDHPIFFSFGGSVGAEGRPGWSEFVKDVGLADMLEDKNLDKNGRNSTGHGSIVNEMRPRYEKAFANFTAEDLVARMRKLGANSAVYMRADQTLTDPQTQAVGVTRDIPGSNLKVLDFPARFSEVELDLDLVAPSLGQHNLTIAQDVGLTPVEIDRLYRNGGLATDKVS